MILIHTFFLKGNTNIKFNIRRKNMEFKTTKTIKTKKSEKCGDCYYNGNCVIKQNSCPYLKKKSEITS